ncbi:hypothetical protein AXW67_32980 [Bradyrhizobium neotropicale]|uniref:Uncharacterized protein n=2 Tax=Bradyrhizobium neotropicale TaxID=1497615 RepID=A0A176YH37_9BRAD|nr:hypothetical protein AXW67_32980 [Bradyrhizobium neotropicale]
MQPMSHFNASATLHLHALISDLHWRVAMLDADIQEAELKGNNSDPSSPTYPTLALTLRDRRSNLRASIETLEGRLDKASDVAHET